MTISIPPGRTISLQAKTGGGFESVGVPTAAPGVWRANEPASHDILYTELDFEFAPNSQSGWATTVSSRENLSLEQDSSVPYNAPFVVRSTITAGRTGGSAPISIFGVDRTKDAKNRYLCFYHKYASNFESNNKLLFVYTDDDSDGAESTTVYLSPDTVESIPGDDWYMRVGIQNEFNRMLTPNLATTPIVLGQWHLIEVLLKSNSAGTADGSVEFWVDGVKNFEDFAVQFRNDSFEFMPPYIQPTWGALGYTAVNTFFHDYSNFYTSGESPV